jgi:hypothetical protein
MDFQKIAHNVLGVIQLKEPVMQAVAADPEATKVAWAGVILGALAVNLGLTFFPVQMGMIVYRPDLFWIIKETILESVVMFAGLYFAGFAAEKWFHSKLSMQGFVRVMGHAAFLGVASLIPLLSILGIWQLVVLWAACAKLGKMQTESLVMLLVALIVMEGLLTVIVRGGGFFY